MPAYTKAEREWRAKVKADPYRAELLVHRPATLPREDAVRYMWKCGRQSARR